jgi:replicative DNA helicase
MAPRKKTPAPEPLPEGDLAGQFKADDQEKVILGAMLRSHDFAIEVVGRMEEAHFGAKIHRDIFRFCKELVERGRKVSVPILSALIPQEPDSPSVPLYLEALRSDDRDSTSAIDSIDMVRAVAAKRLAWEKVGKLKAYALTFDVGEGEGTFWTGFQDLAKPPVEEQVDGFVPFSHALTKAIDLAARAFQNDGKITGVLTGIPSLDEALGGLQPSDLIVIAGRPGMGKTSLAMNIAVSAAKVGQRVGIFSMEMSEDQIAMREVAAASRVPGYKVRRGNFTVDDFDKIAAHAEQMEGLPIQIDPSGGLSITKVAAKARALQRKFGLDLLVIDYLQLMKGSGFRKESNRVQDVTEITSGLKALAKELSVPIIALSQLSRKVEERDDKRPMLSDLRESGSVEQDADVVMFVYREEYYLKNQEPRAGTQEHEEWQMRMEMCHGRADIIIGKQRHGPAATVPVRFDAQFTQFSELTEDERNVSESGRAAPHKLLKNEVIPYEVLIREMNARGGVWISPQEWKTAYLGGQMLMSDNGDGAESELRKHEAELRDASKSLMKSKVIAFDRENNQVLLTGRRVSGTQIVYRPGDSRSTGGQQEAAE